MLLFRIPIHDFFRFPYLLFFPSLFLSESTLKTLNVGLSIYNFVSWRLLSQYGREEEDIGLFITLVPKVLWYRFLLFIAYQQWRFLLNFDWFVQLAECPNVSSPYCNLQRGNFVYHHCINLLPLSFPFRSLESTTKHCVSVCQENYVHNISADISYE